MCVGRSMRSFNYPTCVIRRAGEADRNAAWRFPLLWIIRCVCLCSIIRCAHSQPAPNAFSSSARPPPPVVYYDKLDQLGHTHGPLSKESIQEGLLPLDREIASLVDHIQGLETPIRFMLTADHGMAEVEKVEYIDRSLPMWVLIDACAHDHMVTPQDRTEAVTCINVIRSP